MRFLVGLLLLVGLPLRAQQVTATVEGQKATATVKAKGLSSCESDLKEFDASTP